MSIVTSHLIIKRN